MATFSQRLKELRGERGWYQKELAHELGVSRSTVASWESEASNGFPEARYLLKLATLFSVPIDYLLGKTDDRRAAPAVREPEVIYSTGPVLPHGAIPVEFVPIPILGRIHAGAPTWIEENREGTTYITKDQSRGGEFFALRVHGDCMTGARILPGDLVIVRKQPTVDDGQIAVVYWHGEEEANLRRVRRMNDHVLLTADNPAYPPVLLPPEKVTILGRVVEVKFEPAAARE